MRPDDALPRARQEAERKRALGRYREDPGAVREIEDAIAGPISPRQLREWALIEVDAARLRSTRRGGALVTGAKRLLLRLLRQYTNELEAQQTRFNVAVLERLEELERRIAEIERSER